MRAYLRSFLSMVLIFTCSGQSFADVINVKKLGAKGDGKTDDTKAIQAAINAATGYTPNTIYFPKGIYIIRSYTITKNYLENYFLLIHSNLTFKGEGTASIIRLGDHLFDKKDTSATAQLFFGSNISTITFSNLQIDMNGGKNLCPTGYIKNQRAIFINHGCDVKIEKMIIKNNSGRNMVMIAGSGKRLMIQNCTFLNGGHYVGIKEENKNQVDFSFLYSEWDFTSVINNHIEQQDIDIALSGYTGGIEIHGSYCYAAKNKIIGCYPGFFVSSSWHNMEQTIIENNQIEKCMRGISFWVNFPMSNISILNNSITLTYSRLLKPAILDGIEIPNGNSSDYSFKLANNAPLTNIIIAGNRITSLISDTSKDKTAGMVLHSLQNSTIQNNIITEMNYGGVVLLGSKWGMQSLLVDKNIFLDFKTNNDLKAVGGYVVITDTYSLDKKAAAGLKNINFSNNNFTRNKKITKGKTVTKQAGQFFGGFIALPKAMLSEIHFENNYFSDTAEKIKMIGTGL